MVFTAGGAIGLIHCSDYSRDTIGNTARKPGLDFRVQAMEKTKRY
jgi:hypothetical protein